MLDIKIQKKNLGVLWLLALGMLCYAEDPAAPLTDAVVTNTAPIEAPEVFTLDKNAAYPIEKSKISRWIKNLKIKVDADGNIAAEGLVNPACAQQITLSLDDLDIENSAKIDGNEYPKYPIRIVRYNYIGSKGGVKSQEEECAKITKQCTLHTCIKLSDAKDTDGNSILAGFNSTLNKTGVLVFRKENIEEENGTPNDEDINNEPLIFKDKLTLAKEEAQAQEKAQLDELVELCEKVIKQADEEALEQLKESGLDPKLITELEKDLNNSTIEALEHKLENISQASDLMKLTDEIIKFGKEHKEFKDRVVSLLENIVEKAKDPDTIDRLIDKFANLGKEQSAYEQESADLLKKMVENIDEIEIDTDSPDKRNLFIHKKYKLAKKALKAARKISPKDKDITIALHERTLKHAKLIAGTGDATLYKEMSADSTSAYNNLSNFHLGTSDPDLKREAARVLDTYKRDFIARQIAPTPYTNPQGSIGNGLDETFIMARERIAQQSVQEELRKYQSQNGITY